MDATKGQNFQPRNGGFPGGAPGGPRGGGRGGALMLFGPYGTYITLGLLVLTYVIMAVAMWQFLRKCGLTPWIALLMLAPVVNLGVALWAAFTRWPVLAEVERLKVLVATAQMNAPVSKRSTGEATVDA